MPGVFKHSGAVGSRSRGNGSSNNAQRSLQVASSRETLSIEPQVSGGSQKFNSPVRNIEWYQKEFEKFKANLKKVCRQNGRLRAALGQEKADQVLDAEDLDLTHMLWELKSDGYQKKMSISMANRGTQTVECTQTEVKAKQSIKSSQHSGPNDKAALRPKAPTDVAGVLGIDHAAAVLGTSDAEASTAGSVSSVAAASDRTAFDFAQITVAAQSDNTASAVVTQDAQKETSTGAADAVGADQEALEHMRQSLTPADFELWLTCSKSFRLSKFAPWNTKSPETIVSETTNQATDYLAPDHSNPHDFDTVQTEPEIHEFETAATYVLPHNSTDPHDINSGHTEQEIHDFMELEDDLPLHDDTSADVSSQGSDSNLLDLTPPPPYHAVHNFPSPPQYEPIQFPEACNTWRSALLVSQMKYFKFRTPSPVRKKAVRARLNDTIAERAKKTGTDSFVHDLDDKISRLQAQLNTVMARRPHNSPQKKARRTSMPPAHEDFELLWGAGPDDLNEIMINIGAKEARDESFSRYSKLSRRCLNRAKRMLRP